MCLVNVAVPFAAAAVFAHQGQVCVAASRLFVHSSIYDRFVEAAVKHAQTIKLGNPADPNSQQGPQVSLELRYCVTKTKISWYNSCKAYNELFIDIIPQHREEPAWIKVVPMPDGL